MAKIKVLVLRTAGTNCDKETQFAFQLVGADARLVHINEIINKNRELSDYQILALPGGFTYGDDLGAGKILANELRFKLKKELEKFIKDGKLIIGICNGFQILVKSGLLPGYNEFQQEASLILNDSAKFEDRWTYLKIPNTPSLRSGSLEHIRHFDFAQCDSKRGELVEPLRSVFDPECNRRVEGSRDKSRDKFQNPKCVWVKDLPQIIYLPVAHGEGKFIVSNQDISEKIRDNGQIVFQYCDKEGELTGYPDNPNGSIDNIAGICDDTGRILGLMPHPERHIFFYQHPHWTRLPKKDEGDGLAIFRNGVEYVKKNLC